MKKSKRRLKQPCPARGLRSSPTPALSGQHSLRLDPQHAIAVATFLRDDADLALDFLSNVTGVDWPDKEISEKVKVRTVTKLSTASNTAEETVEETRKRVVPAVLKRSITSFPLPRNTARSSSA